ncbi:MAG: glycosyltransferase family 39 protein [Candidatus Melainabacteria bacterium]|nr:glycosyltransferase family 39 protein [Candidatus Melainabacteria bacterium]
MKTLMDDVADQEKLPVDSKSHRGQPLTGVSEDLHRPNGDYIGSEAKQFGFRVALITVAAAILYALISLHWPKFSRAEVFFAECAREMIATSNMVTPLYHGQAFFDKPILVYWFIIACFKTFGISHFAARIPTILASAATIVVTAYACRSLFGWRAGLIAAMALATSFMYLSFSALCMSDTMLVLVDTITLILMYAGYRAPEKNELNFGPSSADDNPGTSSATVNSGTLAPRTTNWTRTKLWSLAAAAMGLGFLTKGPVAVVLPAAFFIAFLIVERKLSLVKPKHLAFGALALCLIASPWFFLAYNANGMEAITYFFIRENFQRFAGATYDTHRPIWFMLVSLMGGFLPWSVFLPPILYLSIKQFLAQRKTKTPLESSHIQLYLWMWVAVVVGFFSLSRGKIDYYALPAFPACAALVGLYLSKWIDDQNKFAKTAIAILNVALIVVGVGLGLFLSVLPYPAAVSPVVVALVPIAVGCFGLTKLFKGKTFAACVTVFSGVVITGSVFAAVAMPVMTAMQPALQYANDIKVAEKDKPIPVQTVDTKTNSPVAADTTAATVIGTADTPGTATTNTPDTSAPSTNKPGIFSFDHNTIGQNVVGDENSVGIGMYAGLEHWIDEVTFRTGREPIKVGNVGELDAFLSTPGSHWLMIKNVDFDALPTAARARLAVIERRGFIPKSLNPGYIFKNKGNLTGGSELILARSK